MAKFDLGIAAYLDYRVGIRINYTDCVSSNAIFRREKRIVLHLILGAFAPSNRCFCTQYRVL